MSDDKWLEAEDVIPGMIGEDYGEESGKVLLIKQIKKITLSDFKRFNRYDNSGWIPFEYEDLKDLENEFFVENHIEDTDYLVAIKDDEGETAVFIYGGEGFLVPKTEAWKKNATKKLVNANKKSGIMEHLKCFEEWRDSEILRGANNKTGIFDEENFLEVAKKLMHEYENNTVITAAFEELEKYAQSIGYKDYENFSYQVYQHGKLESEENQKLIARFEQKIFELIDSIAAKYVKSKEGISTISSALFNGGPYSNVQEDIIKGLQQ